MLKLLPILYEVFKLMSRAVCGTQMFRKSCVVFFVVFSGLNLASVARLRSTWEKLPSKYEKLFRDLQDIFDPSRNMAKYRNILSSQSVQPPIIPLFPVVKKDLTFLHEGQ